MRQLLISFMLLLATASYCSAQDSEVKLKLPEQAIYLGEPFIGSILLENEAGPVRASFPDSNALSLKVIDSNRMTSNLLLRVSGIALKEGEITLPAFALNSALREYRVPEQTLTVKQPEVSDLIAIDTRWSTNRCYVGQPLTLEFVWTLKTPSDRFAGVDIRVPVLEHADFEVHHAASNPRPGTPKSIGLPVSGTRVIAHTNDKEIRFRKIVVPQQAGRFSFAPAHMVCSIREANQNGQRRGFQYPSYFDNQFFHQPDEGNFKRIFQRAQPITLEVLPLPEADQPANFNGIFGGFDLAVSATPTEVQVGDPITLTLEISNHPFLETIELPPVGELTGFKGLFEVPAVRAPGLIQNNRRVFRQTIRPLREGIKAIPGVPFVYFDPASQTYASIVSDPIPLDVRPGSMASAGDAILSDGTRLRSTIKPLDDGVLENATVREIIEPAWRIRKPFTAWLLALAIPPFLFLGFNRLTRYRQLCLHAPDEARHFVARKAYEHQRADNESAKDIRTALQQYLSDRFMLRKRFPVFRDIETLLALHHVPGETVAATQRFFEQSDETLFSESDREVSNTELQHTADAIVAAVEERTQR